MTRAEHLLALLGDVSGKRVVDIGCGEGQIARAFAAAGADVIGFDPFIDAAAPVELGCGRYELRRAAADAIPLADDSADIVLFVFSLHHVPVGRMEGALAEARRLLVPGGTLCVAEPVADGPAHHVMAPYHDETAVRAAAFAALEAKARPAFGSFSTTRFSEWRRHPDFEDYARQAIANMRFNGYSEDAVRAPEVQRRFAACTDPRGLEQPVRVDLYR